MWMGGKARLSHNPPLGGSRALIVNVSEAETVHTIFTSYLKFGSVHVLERSLCELGVRSKRWTTRKGRGVGGNRYDRGILLHPLRQWQRHPPAPSVVRQCSRSYRVGALD
jgi:site-specific DNA recombinase